MPELIEKASTIEAAGTPAKTILEFVGRVNTQTEALSVARMISPQGWREPGQRPAFDEATVVTRGVLTVESEAGTFKVRAGQAILARRGEWVRYSTPDPGGAEYFAVCVPAFSPDAVHRDES